MSESPREAIEATLALVSAELSDTGLGLKPGLILKRKRGDQTHIIGTQARARNQAGVMARFEITAWLESDRLGAWKKSKWPDRSASITRFDRLVDTLRLVFPGTSRHAEWDVVDPSVRPAVAKEAAEIIRAQALPWFEQAGDPVAALGNLVTNSIQPSLIDYAVATDNLDAARARIAAIASSNAKFAETLEAVRQNGKPNAYRDAFEPIAWAAVSSGVA